MRRLLLTAAFLVSAIPAHADEYGFAQWLYGFKQRAAYQGFDQSFLNRALTGTEYLPRVIELDGKQPEHKITFKQYKKNILTDQRIREGREKLSQHYNILSQVSEAYGVPPQYIVALWGIETNYGKITGGFDIVSALATLAYEGRRAQFFEKELVGALRILEGGHAGTDKLTGSWAGAMGQSQFMPSSYHKYAVDGNGDGMVDIWNSLPDVFASIANYLRTEGWNKDVRWGRAVKVPVSIPEAAYGRENMRPLSEWMRRGVKQADGSPLHMPSDGKDPKAALVAPDGIGTPTFLVYENFNIIMHWNRSTYFATSVGLLADAIAHRPD
ncbi:MAG: lytic murein transglycosylase [Alphaproteobacteria bacterium]|nr:lytic murein transglycosylase [Alphaproteobacteria bacterium]